MKFTTLAVVLTGIISPVFSTPIPESETVAIAQADVADLSIEAIAARYDIQCSSEAQSVCKPGAVINGNKVDWDCNGPGTPSNMDSNKGRFGNMCSSCKCVEQTAVCAGAGNRLTC